MSLKIRKFSCGKFAFRSWHGSTVELEWQSTELQVNTLCDLNWNSDLFNTKIKKKVGSEYVKSWQNMFFVKKFWELLVFFLIFVSLRYTALICSWLRVMLRILNLFTRRTDFSLARLTFELWKMINPLPKKKNIGIEHEMRFIGSSKRWWLRDLQVHWKATRNFPQIA